MLNRDKWIPLLLSLATALCCHFCFNTDVLFSGDDLDMGVSCINSLSGVGAGDFLIKFKLATRATATSTLLYQRSTCDAASDLWDISLTPDGHLRIAIIEASTQQYTDLTTTVVVTDGQPHDIAVSRAVHLLSTTTDGRPSGYAPAPQVLGQLPPFGMSTGNPCEVAGVKPLVGVISEVCLERL